MMNGLGIIALNHYLVTISKDIFSGFLCYLPNITFWFSAMLMAIHVNNGINTNFVINLEIEY